MNKGELNRCLVYRMINLLIGCLGTLGYWIVYKLVLGCVENSSPMKILALAIGIELSILCIGETVMQIITYNHKEVSKEDKTKEVLEDKPKEVLEDKKETKNLIDTINLAFIIIALLIVAFVGGEGLL